MSKTYKQKNRLFKGYNELVVKADLAENSSRQRLPGYRETIWLIWEKMKSQLDKMFKDTGHQNAYFPLFVPKVCLRPKKKILRVLAKECAVVTHYRLKNDVKSLENLKSMRKRNWRRSLS